MQQTVNVQERKMDPAFLCLSRRTITHEGSLHLEGNDAPGIEFVKVIDIFSTIEELKT